MVNKMRKTGKKGKVTQAVLLILLFMAVAIAGYSGFRLWKYYHEYLEDQELYEDLRDEILQTPELETDTESVFELDTRKKHHKTSESEIPFDVDWDVLKDINIHYLLPAKPGKKSGYYRMGLLYGVATDFLPGFAGKR